MNHRYMRNCRAERCPPSRRCCYIGLFQQQQKTTSNDSCAVLETVILQIRRSLFTVIMSYALRRATG
eukprot:scaffold24072_cov125-Amphora_coffeaeformis.AAC.1